MKKLLLLLIVIKLFASDGENLYNKYGCYGCHGPNAKGSSSYPSLVNKNKNYLIDKLKSYRNGEVNSLKAGIMSPFAKKLSDEDIISLSLYLESVGDRVIIYEDLEWDIEGSGGS